MRRNSLSGKNKTPTAYNLTIFYCLVSEEEKTKFPTTSCVLVFILGPISEESQEVSSNLPAKSVLNHVLEPLTPQNFPKLNGTPKLIFMFDLLQEDAVKVRVKKEY